jgi:hypothetical protein
MLSSFSGKMSWLPRAIIDFINSLVARYYRRKYGAVARRLHRLPDAPDGQRGFVILELDGLAYQYLRRALKRGAMPYLARQIQKHKLRLARWRCGLPSTTPASQAGIFYGNNWDIPGFRWYDKATGEAILCKIPGHVRAVQDRISAGRIGLLHGGSSYANMFDGDARLALLTLAAVGRDRVLEDVRGLGFVVLFLLSPLRVLRALGLSLWTWLAYLAKLAAAALAPGRPLTLWGSLSEVLSNVLFREITTFSVMLDIYRGMPAVYASYAGYDEIAHHFGVDSREANRALRGLDAQIRQIDRIRHRYKHREYDLYILSDHGLSPSVPFRRIAGQSLHHFVAGHTGRQVMSDDEAHGSEALGRIYAMLDEIRGLEARPHGLVVAQLLQLAHQRLDRRQSISLLADWDLTRSGEVVVRSSGSLSHLYFNVTVQQMALGEVTLLYPALLEALVAHEAIGLVVGREGEDVVIVGHSGTMWLGPGGRRLVGQDPLSGCAEPGWAAEQIARLARFPHSGDLILLGAWDGEHAITFEEQLATHGGLGGPQDWPFLATTARDRPPVRGIRNAEELYSWLTGARAPGP